MDTNQNTESSHIKLDISLATPEERIAKVNEIIAATPAEKLTPKYLTILADYIMFLDDKQKRKELDFITDNKLVTINKRETSYEGLAGKLENGEDGIYNMMTNDKTIIFSPKTKITKEDRRVSNQILRTIKSNNRCGSGVQGCDRQAQILLKATDNSNETGSVCHPQRI